MSFREKETTALHEALCVRISITTQYNSIHMIVIVCWDIFEFIGGNTLKTCRSQHYDVYLYTLLIPSWLPSYIIKHWLNYQE